jgi:hypothetical protein
MMDCCARARLALIYDRSLTPGMHPTANSATFMRETPANQRLVAAADDERWLFTVMASHQSNC